MASLVQSTFDLFGARNPHRINGLPEYSLVIKYFW